MLPRTFRFAILNHSAPASSTKGSGFRNPSMHNSMHISLRASWPHETSATRFHATWCSLTPFGQTGHGQGGGGVRWNFQRCAMQCCVANSAVFPCDHLRRARMGHPDMSQLRESGELASRADRIFQPGQATASRLLSSPVSTEQNPHGSNGPEASWGTGGAAQSSLAHAD